MQSQRLQWNPTPVVPVVLSGPRGPLGVIKLAGLPEDAPYYDHALGIHVNHDFIEQYSNNTSRRLDMGESLPFNDIIQRLLILCDESVPEVPSVSLHVSNAPHRQSSIRSVFRFPVVLICNQELEPKWDVSTVIL